MNPQLESPRSSARYISYVVGFVLSIIITLVAYFLVVNHVLPTGMLLYVILAIAVVQLVVQMVFFLHIGRGSRWKIITFAFAILVVVIIAGGTIWIMNNLNYNLMRMTPAQEQIYMQQNEGI